MQHQSPANCWLDFNLATDQLEGRMLDSRARKASLWDQLMAGLEGYLFHLLPAGKKKNGRFVVGDSSGSKGQSLSVDLSGSKAGMWYDFATGEGGDIFDLFAAVWGFDTQNSFSELLHRLEGWLGACPAQPFVPHVDELGAYTTKWDYTDRDGNLLACIYRYDTDKGKEFRSWDVTTRKIKAPEIRPLYNLPGLLVAKTIVLVEGEKCADVLIDVGIAATTAMFGAKAPLEKTDWSPLKDKRVIIWPDNDAAGFAYAQSLVAALPHHGVLNVAVITPPQDKREKWDAADALSEGFDYHALLSSVQFNKVKSTKIPSYALQELLADNSPMPADLVSPRVITPGSILVFGGAPKVGKSDFLLSWFIHLAAGESFLGMIPSGQLKIFYFQAEIQYHYLRERVQSLAVSSELRALAGKNLVMTPQLRRLLNKECVDRLAEAILEQFPGGPDIIAIDPIRNVFDGGRDGGSENDNTTMMFFLTERVERLAQMVNPCAAVILVHHTRKLTKKQLEEDPFQALSGASALRGFYSSGLLLFRPDEGRTKRHLFFELRNGPGIPFKLVDKHNGCWLELDKDRERLIHQDYGQKLDAERRRKHDVILQIVFEEAKAGRAYTMNQFCQAFENCAGLSGETTIRRRLDVLSTKGYIKFFRDAEKYGIAQSTRTKYGFMCVEGMRMGTGKEVINPETGEVSEAVIPVLPSYYKCRSTAVALPVEDPDIWIYCEEDNL